MKRLIHVLPKAERHFKRKDERLVQKYFDIISNCFEEIQCTFTVKEVPFQLKMYLYFYVCIFLKQHTILKSILTLCSKSPIYTLHSNVNVCEFSKYPATVKVTWFNIHLSFNNTYSEFFCRNTLKYFSLKYIFWKYVLTLFKPSNCVHAFIHRSVRKQMNNIRMQNAECWTASIVANAFIRSKYERSSPLKRVCTYLAVEF